MDLQKQDEVSKTKLIEIMKILMKVASSIPEET